MLSEQTICELLSSMLPSGRLNRCFESDAEIIQVGGVSCLFTTDEFSDEDLFNMNDPYALGWNIAVGGISDILACGGYPLYYAHALTVNKTWTRDYVIEFGSGVREVLEATGARFIGGDCGWSELWRCTVSVIGSCEGQPITRRGAAPGDLVYLSGDIGRGNLEAALTLDEKKGSASRSGRRNQFALRQRESAVMKRHASSCLDTSDGVWSGLNSLADLNRCGYAVENLPYLAEGLEFCQHAGWPKTLLFLGGCGEYELLFTVRPDQETVFLEDAEMSKCAFHRLGCVTPALKTLQEDGRAIDLTGLSLDPRGYETPQAYLEALLHWVKNASG
jgi:thiamine-monophosphate kinase